MPRKKTTTKKTATKKTATKKKTLQSKLVPNPGSLGDRLAQSRENSMTAQENRHSKAMAQVQSDLKEAEKALKIEKAKSNDLGKKLKAAESEIERLGKIIAEQTQKAKGKKAQQFTKAEASIPVAGSSIRIAKKGSNKQYPESFFPVDVLEAEQLEDDTTIEDIKEYIKDELGKGTYKIFAMTKNARLGFEQKSGAVIFSC